MSRLLTNGMGYKPHRGTTPIIRDLDMIRNALAALPLEGALYELSVLRTPNRDSVTIQLRLDAPPTIPEEPDTVPDLPSLEILLRADGSGEDPK